VLSDSTTSGRVARAQKIPLFHIRSCMSVMYPNPACASLDRRIEIDSGRITGYSELCPIFAVSGELGDHTAAQPEGIMLGPTTSLPAEWRVTEFEERRRLQRLTRRSIRLLSKARLSGDDLQRFRIRTELHTAGLSGSAERMELATGGSSTEHAFVDVCVPVVRP